MVAPFVAAAAFILAAAPLQAEVLPSVKLTLLHSLYRTEGGAAEFLGTGTARLGLEARGNPLVRAGLAIDARLGEAFYGPAAPSAEPPETGAVFDVSRAWVRARFPLGDDYTFRVMTGKNSLSWGHGVYFNAGDLLFGSSTAAADFTSDVLRDETRWLLSAYFPLGRYAFFEPLVLPPAYVFGDASGGPDRDAADAEKTSAGGRLQAKWLGTVWEAGYLYRGTEAEHNPYVSLQGHFLLDWYAAAAARLPAFGPDAADLRQGLEISAGLFHISGSPELGTLTLRLEALVRPDSPWREADSESTVSPDWAARGILLFPEIVFTPSPSVGWVLRSVVSPADRSAFVSGGLTWKPYQGFSLLLFLSGMAGEESDLFGWDRTGGIGCTVGAVYSF